jgi:hypothetical protein
MLEVTERWLAGLEKTRFLLTQPSGFFGFCGFFVFFWFFGICGFFGFFGIFGFLVFFGFLYICPEERVFGVFQFQEYFEVHLDFKLYRKSPKFGHFLNFNHFFQPEIIFFQICFTIQKSCMALSTSGLNHQT